MKIKMLSIIILTCFFAFQNQSKAQDVNYGIKGGLTFSNLYIDKDELDDENARLGLNAGFFSQFLIADAFGIQPEFLFSAKGTEATYEGMIDQTVDFKMNYIDIPVLAVIKPIEILEIHAGPYFGFLLNSNVDYSGTIEGTDEIDRDHLNTVDFGLSGGAALNFGSLQTGVRYNLGLQKIADSDAADFLLGDSKHSYGQIYLALKLSKE